MEATKYFRTRTNVVHRLLGGYNVVPCNTRNAGFRGCHVMLTKEELALAKKCEKCFPLPKVEA